MTGINAFRCSYCAALWFPERLACPRCYCLDLVQETVTKGKLVNWTRRGDGELVVATAELSGGTMVVGRLIGNVAETGPVRVAATPDIETGLYVPDVDTSASQNDR